MLHVVMESVMSLRARRFFFLQHFSSIACNPIRKNVPWKQVARKKRSFVFRHCLILRLLLLRSFVMGPDSLFLSRDQYVYLYGNQGKNSKMKKQSSEVKYLVTWHFRLLELFRSWVSLFWD